ncbi:MAG: 30S ribosomal protein S2 [Planctomycetes bacterium]|nr:30S ribosomal protein S2 [Planctomycetota bacterium]
MNKELARDLIGAGIHFGHGVSRWNPKMEPYIFGKRGMIHVIDVKETLKGLLIAKKLLVEVVSSGKDVVFVGTKRQAQKAVTDAAEKSSMHYVCERWLGGMLTNFRTIRSRLQRLEELETMEASGKLAEESKKQGSRLKREMRKISTNLGGVRKMSKLPGAVVVVDVRKEHIALREARKLGIVTIGIVDTDSDPDTVDIAIPANDDSLKAIELLLNELVAAVAAGKVSFKAPTGPARGRSKRRALATADDGNAPTTLKAASPAPAAPAAAPATTESPAPVSPAPASPAPAAPAEVKADVPAQDSSVAATGEAGQVSPSDPAK